MNAKYKNLYQELVSRDMTDLDENSFYNEYSQNDEKFSELYSYLDSNELTDLDPETFKLEYFGTPIIKKKSQVESTDSDSEVGSSERLSTTTTRQLEPSIYILPSNPGALYRKKGDSWLKKIGENYIPLSKGDVRARERILDKQAVLASDFQADWYSNQPKEFEMEYGSVSDAQIEEKFPGLTKERWKGVTVGQPVTDKSKIFRDRDEEEASDLKMPETKIEPATFEGKLYMLEEGKDNENFYKNPVTEETYLYWLDNNGKPKERLDPIKSQEAVDMAANIIGESQMKQLSKINKIDKIDLNKRDVDKFLKKELYGSNFGFNQEGNELTINSYFPGMNGDDEGLENSITIDLSKSNSSSIAKEFLRYNLFTKREKEGLENIKDTESYIDAMINSNGKIKMTSDRVNMISDWAKTESIVIENEIKKGSVDVIDKDIKSYEEKTKLFKKRVASGNMTQQEFDKENDDLSKLYKDIIIKQKKAQGISNRIQKLTNAEELIQKKVAPEEKGSTIGALVKSFASGVANLALTAVDYSLSGLNIMIGDEKFAKLIDGNYEQKKAKGLTDAQIANSSQAEVKDFAKEKYDLGWQNITGTNKEYIRSENRGMIPQALNAVAESFGTAATGGALGKVGSTAAFFSMSYNAMEDQMRGPDFDHLSENEKKLISVPYGLVIGQMEKWGFEVAVGAGKNPLFNKFANYIVTKTFKNLPKNAGLIELNSAIQKNIGASIAKGLIKITGAGVSEGNVEFMQQEFEGIQKFAVNEILKNDNFNEEYFKDAPDLSKAGGWSELMGQGVDAFKLGFLAGGMTSTGASVKDNITDISSNNKFDIYKSFVLNTESRNGWIASIKEDEKNGKISPEEMNKKIDELNKSYSVLTKIPASLTTQSQREAFSLLQEREIIQNEIKDKDPNLVVKETNRIKEINEALKTTSENATKEDNIKQQEGTAEGGISEYQGTGEGQQEVGVSQGGQRETTINEADSGDSTVASKVQQEEQVATLRAEEQAELLKAIPKIESYKVNGEIDKTLMPKTVLAKYNKIYDKYDNLISPLLETTGEVAIDKPIITTNTTAEVSRVKSLTPESEDGATFNIDGTKYEGVGLVVPVDSMNTTTEELTPEMVADFVAERQEMIGDAGVVKAGIYKFPNSNQVSIDLSVVVPETSREQALEFARLAGQESLFDLETFENIKTGATGENPMKFTPEQHREISKALKEGRMPNVFGATTETTKNLLTKENVNEVTSKQTTPKNKLIVKAAKMVLNAIPGVKIYIHNNGQEMASAIESSKKQLTKEEKTGLTESSGLYVDGDIHINLESATIGTVYHEAFHALIEKNGMKSGSILLMAKGLKNIISDKGVKQRLDDFVSQYNEDEKAEEYISELGGILSEAEQELTTTKLQQFKTLINNIAKKLGLPVIFSASATAQDAADFINTMSKKLRTGEEIKDLSAEGKDGKIKRQSLSNIDINKVRSKDRPGKKVSKGLSVKMVDGKKVIEETEDLSLEYVKENAPSIFISNANIIARYPLVAGKQKFKKASTIDEAQNIYDVFIREVANNLNYLMAEFKSDLRDLATLWYDGANALANDFADKFGISAEQAAGIIASMSPQKDWYQNVRLAELVMMAYKDNPVMTQSMIDYQKTVNEKGLYDGATSPGKKLKKAEKAYSESRTKLNKEVLEKAKVKMEEAIVKANAVITMLDKYVGKKLNDTPQYVQPYMVRTYHEVNTTKDYNIVAPDGSVQGVAKKKNGANAKVAWGSYSEIGKAVSIINDGSQENITKSLGQMHKIRNFHNNIIDPMSKDGDVTMDTHAIAAALLLPLSGNSTQVGQNFGTNTSNSGPLGIKGLYYAYAEAYALAAKEAGLLPRQVQSITWEAVRGLYTDTFKSNKNLVTKINNIWKNYEDGKITVNEAREQAKEAAGGIQDPTWAGGPIQDKSGEGIGQEGIGTGSKGDGRDIVGGKLGGDIEDQPSKIKFQKNLTQSVEKRLTEDENGNYVFHHYSRSKRDSIKPTTGDGSFIVSKDEASALASVNGVAQYYAMADQVEQGVGGVQHTVLVPKDEVYYLQDDKLNLYDKAKEEFQKARPGQAFNPNYQAAWIGKVANDMGYKMLVSEWKNGELRAQTTLELKPEVENTQMKPREEVSFNVGDKVNVFGDDAVITEMNGDIASYKGEKSSGSINVARNKQSIVKLTEETPSKIKKQLTTDKYAKPGAKLALDELGETNDQREAWRKNNKVNQKQKRNPIVEQAVKDYYNEKINQEQYLDIVAKNQPIKPFKTVPALPSLEDITNSLDISKVATGIIGLTKNLENGEKVASRLDIPAYEDYDTWVVSLHDGNKEGKSIAYGQTAVLKNVDFKTFPGSAIRIAMGTQNKSTIGRMFGDWVNEDPELVHARAKELINDPAWTQVGMNPFRYSWFYDKSDGMPVASADEVIQVGALVLAKNAKKVLPSDPIFETKSAKGGKIKFQKTAPNGKPSKLDDVQWEQVRTPAFKKWFGDWENDPKNASKIVDENGEPLVVYHGSNEIFDEFKNRLFGYRGFYFTDKKSVAKTYGSDVRPFFLNSKDFVLEDMKGDSYSNNEWIDDLIETSEMDNKDVHLLNFIDPLDPSSTSNVPISNIYVIFNKSNIKIADGTNTTFDATQPSIKLQKTSQETRMDKESENVFKESLDRGTNWATATQDALDYIQKSKWYQEATDIEREQKVRDFKESKNQKLKKAPSVAKILGKPKPETQTKTVNALRKEFFTAWNKASRDAKANLDAKRKAIGAIIKSMVRSGKITIKQAASITDRASSINLDNPVIVQRFLDYVAKVFADANYQEKLSNAFTTRKAIRGLTKSNNQAEIIGMAKMFLNIDPSMVEDIDTYNEIADSIKNAMAPSVTIGEKVKFKQPANIADVNEYTMDELSRQEEIRKDQLLAEYDYLKEAGLISKDMTLNEIKSIIEEMKSPEAETENNKVNEFVTRRLDMMLGVVESIIRTGVNPITGEAMEISDKNKDILKAIMKMDLKELDTRSLIYLSESVDNFLNNGITSGLEANVQSYIGAMNVKALVNAGVKSVSIRTVISRSASKEILSIPLFFEKIFRGTIMGNKVMKEMGFLDLVRGKNTAEMIYNMIMEEYTKQDFYGKDFMTHQNIIERGMLGYLMRNVNGDPLQVKSELNRRIESISQSIDRLKEGNKDEQKLAEMYEIAYSKLNLKSKDIDLIRANSSKQNRQAVDWWIDQWKQHYTDLYDVSLSVYNTMLSSDTNYTPDKQKLISSRQTADQDISKTDSSFGSNLQYTDTKKSGVLMENSRTLAKNRYIDLNFDSNNANSLRNALVDIKTAGTIRQLKGFIDSENFYKLAGDQAAVIKDRVNTYVKRMKGKGVMSKDNYQEVMKYFNALSKAGTIRALGGIGSAIKQFSPIINTLINSGRFTSLTPSSSAWIDRLGMPISNRGIQAEANIDSINKKTNALSESPLGKVYDGVSQVGDMWLKALIQYPDVYVARSSFITYYLKSLRDQGLSEKIDWDNHVENKKASEYAQIMLDRQQNISDPLLAGDLFMSENNVKTMVTKVIMPFTSFVWNQRARMINDIQISFSKHASNEDKKIARLSLIALPAEIIVFNVLGAAIRKTIDAITNYLYGEDDDEEEVLFYVFGMKITEDDIKEVKTPIRNMLVDLFSPLPGMTDEPLVSGLNKLFEQFPLIGDDEISELVKVENDIRIANGEKPMDDKQKEKFIEQEKEKRKFQLYENMEPTGLERYIPGAPGVALKTYTELYDAMSLALTGKYETENEFGKKTIKYISDEDRKKIGYGLYFQIAQVLNLLPREAGTITSKGIRNIKRRASTENKKTKTEELEKMINRPVGKIEKVLIDKNVSSKNIFIEMKYIDKAGGFTESQQNEYAKLRKIISKTNYYYIKSIQSGMTSEDIIKRIVEARKK